MSIENKFENREADQEYDDFVKEYEILSGKMEKLYSPDFDKEMEGLRTHGKEFWVGSQDYNNIQKKVMSAVEDYAFNRDWVGGNKAKPEDLLAALKSAYEQEGFTAAKKEHLDAYFRKWNGVLKDFGLDDRLQLTPENVSQGYNFQEDIIAKIEQAKEDSSREIDEKLEELKEKNPELWERYQVELKQESDKRNR